MTAPRTPKAAATEPAAAPAKKPAATARRTPAAKAATTRSPRKPPAPKDPPAALIEPVLTVTVAAASGTPRQLLVAMRDRVAQAVEDKKTAPRDLAALTRRLREIARDIEAIDAKDAGEADSADVSDAKFEPEAI